MGYFVRPDTVRLALPNGEALTVRARLNMGDQRRRLDRVYRTTDDDRVHVQTLEIGRATVLAYLVDWTLTDDAGAPVPIRGLDVEALALLLDHLEPDTFKEIREAIDGHERRQELARDAEKKTRNGASALPPTSRSLVGASGGTNG